MVIQGMAQVIIVQQNLANGRVGFVAQLCPGLGIGLMQGDFFLGGH